MLLHCRGLRVAIPGQRHEVRCRLGPRPALVRLIPDEVSGHHLVRSSNTSTVWGLPIHHSRDSLSITAW